MNAEGCLKRGEAVKVKLGELVQASQAPDQTRLSCKNNEGDVSHHTNCTQYYARYGVKTVSRLIDTWKSCNNKNDWT